MHEVIVIQYWKEQEQSTKQYSWSIALQGVELVWIYTIVSIRMKSHLTRLNEINSPKLLLLEFPFVGGTAILEEGLL